MSNTQKQWGAIIVMIALFAMIAFVTRLCDPMGVIVKNQFGCSNLLAQIGAYGNYGAYLLMGIPSGMIVEKVGYKKTALIGLIVGIVGILIQWLSGQFGFAVYLVGALISGACMCILNTVVNPMLTSLGGGGAEGNRLIQIGGIFNSTAGIAVIIIMGSLMGDAATAQISDATPCLFIAIAIFVIAFLVIMRTKIEEPQQPAKSENKTKDKYSAWSFRHFVLGALAICCYGALEVSPTIYILQYLTAPIEAAEGVVSGLGMNAAYASSLGALYIGMMLIGRMVGVSVLGKVSNKASMIFVSGLSLIFIIAGILLPTSILVPVPGINLSTLEVIWGEIPVGILSFLCIGLCASVMWGGIFSLATEGLGKYTAMASGIFMTMVAGFAVFIGLQGLVADLTNDYITSFIVPLIAGIYILYYSVIGHKNVNTDIPVD